MGKRIILPDLDGNRHYNDRWLMVFNAIKDHVISQEAAEKLTDDVFIALEISIKPRNVSAVPKS